VTHDVPLDFLSSEEFPQLSRAREIIISTRSNVGSFNRQQIPDAPWIVAELTNLGIDFSDGSRLFEAEEILVCAIKIQESINHPTHPDLLRPLITLGVVFAKQRRFPVAENTLLRALVIVGKADAKIEEHKLTLLNLIYVYRQQNRTEYEARMQDYLSRLLGENRFVIKEHHTQRKD
jgi:hypothetical protein